MLSHSYPQTGHSYLVISVNFLRLVAFCAQTETHHLDVVDDTSVGNGDHVRDVVRQWNVFYVAAICANKVGVVCGIAIETCVARVDMYDLYGSHLSEDLKCGIDR